MITFYIYGVKQNLLLKCLKYSLYPVMINISYCTFIQTHRLHNTKSELTVNYGLLVIMMGSLIVTSVSLW